MMKSDAVIAMDTKTGSPTPGAMAVDQGRQIRLIPDANFDLALPVLRRCRGDVANGGVKHDIRHVDQCGADEVLARCRGGGDQGLQVVAVVQGLAQADSRSTIATSGKYASGFFCASLRLIASDSSNASAASGVYEPKKKPPACNFVRIQTNINKPVN
ncbi:MAG: hypothetical protein RL748_1573 [Pseudomonadota bacterium]|jgi:hypothetical protein